MVKLLNEDVKLELFSIKIKKVQNVQIIDHIKRLLKQSRMVYRLSWRNIWNMGEIMI